MPLFKCEWPNGDVSFVLARDIDNAIEQLDEFDTAEPHMITKVREFMLDLRPNRKALEANERARKEGRDTEVSPWELSELGECMLEPEGSVLPSDTATLGRIRKFEKEGRSRQREQELRQQAEREGTLIDLTMRRLKEAARRSQFSMPAEPADEP